MTSNALECGVCSNVFSEEYCPRILPCSHTLCGGCIDGIITDERISCPFCREEFPAASAEDIVINRFALDIAKQFSSQPMGPNTSSEKAECSVEKIVSEFKTKFIEKGIADCHEIAGLSLDTIENLNGMKNDVVENNKEIDVLIEMLQKMKLSNDSTLGSIDESTDQLKSMLDVVLVEAKKIESMLIILSTSKDSSGAEDTVREAEQIIYGLQKKFNDIKEILQVNGGLRKVTEKEILDMKSKLENIAEEIGRESGEDSPVNITVNNLRGQCGSLRGGAQREIFAVKMLGWKQRVAPVKSKVQVFLSHLDEGEIPPKGCVIEHESLLQNSSSKAFLDLAVNGTFLGRLVIQVMSESNKALNFLHMCSGDLGPSYANSQPIVGWRGKEGEHVEMGEYLVDRRTSTEAVLTGVDWRLESQREIYETTSYREGEVRGWFSHEKASRFYIVTRDHPTWKRRNCFGKVVEGFDVLKKAISRYHISEIKIADCGLILSL
ncbi:uncharacterized protein [Palaemon carinicauda]|uniref:uncharacterized protein n=1 Tax=Palaemon carinicauda TaxID=392227 RepID=UPI0035B62702